MSSSELWSRFAHVHALMQHCWLLILINEATGEVHGGYEKGTLRRYYVRIAERLGLEVGCAGNRVRQTDLSKGCLKSRGLV